MGKQEGVETYDLMHLDESESKLAVYLPLFEKVLAEVARRQPRRILEVGCGSGTIASMILGRLPAAGYCGFDFSPVGLEMARARTGRPELFFQGDATLPETYKRAGSYDTIVCTEVLEHINADRQVVERWRQGTDCVCTVPNFDQEGHVRYFRHEEEVIARYGDLIAIDRVERVAKPVFAGLTFREYLRKLRWSRDDRRKFAGLLGYRTFDYVAGWFLFTGRRA